MLSCYLSWDACALMRRWTENVMRVMIIFAEGQSVASGVRAAAAHPLIMSIYLRDALRSQGCIALSGMHCVLRDAFG